MVVGVKEFSDKTFLFVSIMDSHCSVVATLHQGQSMLFIFDRFVSDASFCGFPPRLCSTSQKYYKHDANN